MLRAKFLEEKQVALGKGLLLALVRNLNEIALTFLENGWVPKIGSAQTGTWKNFLNHEITGKDSSCSKQLILTENK